MEVPVIYALLDCPGVLLLRKIDWLPGLFLGSMSMRWPTIALLSVHPSAPHQQPVLPVTELEPN